MALALTGVVPPDTVRGTNAAAGMPMTVAEAFHLLQSGVARCQEGNPAAAAACFRAVLALRPDHPEALSNLTLALGAQGDAVVGYRRALRLQPDYAELHYNLANALQERGDARAAAAHHRRAIALKPDHADAHNNLGNALKDQDPADEALRRFHSALRLTPEHPKAFNNLGITLRGIGRDGEAIAAFRRSLALAPDYAEALCNLGGTLHDVGRLDEALTAHGRAVRREPAFPDSRWNLALSLLLRGDIERGWAEYEWRWRRRGFASAAALPPLPLWRGEPGHGRTLLVIAEQGLGDTLQFIRHAPVAARSGWRVVVEAPRPLLRLLGSLPGVVLIAQGDPRPAADMQCPMLSLPRAVGTTPETVPSAVPYLRAEPERVAAWAGRLPAGFRVGIVWQGNPQGTVDRGRSFPLAALEPLARVPGVRLVSLQKVHGLDQLDRLPEGMAVTTLGPGFDSGPDAFVDTAAVMESLDLIVTSDTSVAHLAGALGRPVWLALKAVPDWRWLMQGDTSPWYPTMRLFRQAKAGDWRPVFHRMAETLVGLVNGDARARMPMRYTLIV